MTANLEQLLTPGCRWDGVFWSKEGNAPGGELWDKLAARDHMRAAVSALDVMQEERKTRPTIELLEGILDGGIILDLGCGYGRLAKYLLPRTTFAGYIGVDGSKTMLRLFADRYSSSPQEQKTPLLLVNSDIDNVIIQDSSVDAVVCSAVFLHNEKAVTRRALQEMHRITKPGGTIVIIGGFLNARTLAGLQGSLYIGVLRLLGRGQMNGPCRYFTRSEIAEMMDAFEEVRILANGFAHLPKRVLVFPDRLNRIYRRFAYDPVDRWLSRVTPQAVRRRLSGYYDVVARRP